MLESFRFNPFKRRDVSTPEISTTATPIAEKQTIETPTQYVISREDWIEGERPEGYVSTDGIVDKAHARGLHISDVIGVDARNRRDELIKKVKSKGLDQAECDELVRYSQEISRLLNEKMQ